MFIYSQELQQTYSIILICLTMTGFYLTTITTGTVGDTLTLGQEALIPGFITGGILIVFVIGLAQYVIKDIINQDQDKE